MKNPLSLQIALNGAPRTLNNVASRIGNANTEERDVNAEREQEWE